MSTMYWSNRFIQTVKIHNPKRMIYNDSCKRKEDMEHFKLHAMQNGLAWIG